MRQVVPGARFWHVTNERHFTPSSAARPTVAGGWDRASKPTLAATSSPFYWSQVSGGGAGPWTAGRKYAAEVEVLPGHPETEGETAIQPEVALDPAYVAVRRIVPLSDAIAEETGYDANGNSVPAGFVARSL